MTSVQGLPLTRLLDIIACLLRVTRRFCYTACSLSELITSRTQAQTIYFAHSRVALRILLFILMGDDLPLQ